MAIWFRTKDPAEALAYTADFSAELGTDTIASVAWTVSAGLTKDQETFTTTLATVKVSGGTLGQVYEADCAATGASGQIYNRKLYLKIEDK